MTQTRKAKNKTQACLETYVVVFIVVRKGRKPPSTPEFGTPQDDVCRGWFGNIQFSRERVTNLSPENTRGFLGKLVIILCRLPAKMPFRHTSRLCIWVFRAKLWGDDLEENEALLYRNHSMKSLWKQACLCAVLSLEGFFMQGKAVTTEHYLLHRSPNRNSGSWENLSCLHLIERQLDMGTVSS